MLWQPESWRREASKWRHRAILEVAHPLIRGTSYGLRSEALVKSIDCEESTSLAMPKPARHLAFFGIPDIIGRELSVFKHLTPLDKFNYRVRIAAREVDDEPRHRNANQKRVTRSFEDFDHDSRRCFRTPSWLD